MSKRWILLGLIGVGIVMGIAVAGADEKTSLDQVPAAVREALLRLATGGQILEIERETEDGAVLYEAEWVVNGHKTEGKVTASGDLVELEEKVDAEKVPTAVKTVVAQEFPAGATVQYEKVMVVFYEAEGKVDGREKEVLITAMGKLVGQEDEGDDGDDDDGDDDDGEDNEEDIALDQIPAAVKATLLAEAKGATIKEVERETRNGQTVYEAEWIVAGQEIEIKVAADGTLLKKEIEQDDDDDDDG